MMKSSQHTSTLLFLITLAVSLSLWIYAVFTTVIEEIDIGYLPIFRELPVSYWVGFALVILATIIWYRSPQTRSVHFLLVLFWALFLFVGPELADANARGTDTFAHIHGIKWLEVGRLWEFYYGPWPGYYYLSFPLQKILNISYHDLPKLLEIAYSFLIAIIALGFARTLFKERRTCLFASLLFLALLWQPLLFPAPNSQGFLLVIVLLTLLFSRKMPALPNRILLIIVFAALTITHGLATLLIITFLVFFALMRLTKRDLGYRQDLTAFTLPALFLVMFTVWLMHSSSWVFATAVNNFIEHVMRNPLLMFTPGVEHFAPFGTTPPREFALWLGLFFYAVVLVWLLVVAGRREFWSKLSLGRVFPLLCTIPLIVIFPTGSYGYEVIHRIFLFSIPFVVWFFARESRPRGVITIFFLVFLLALCPAERYATEYVYHPPTGEFVGAKFLCDKAPHDFIVLYAWRPCMGCLVGNPPGEEPITYCYQHMKYRKIEIRLEIVDFVIDSSFTRNHIIYTYGQKEYDQLSRELATQDAVYSNGEFTVYAISRVPAFE